MAKAKSVVDTILGEAVHGTRAQRYADMLSIASVIANRARATNTTPEQVISARGQFDAYGKPLPKGVEAYRDLAEQAVRQVEIEGPIHNATFYATPNAAKNLPKGLQEVSRTSGHVYYTDPQNRPIATAKGYVRPVADALANLSNAAVQTVNAVTAPVQNAAAALRTAAFDPVVAAIPSIPSIPTPTARPSAPVAPGLASYSRENLTPGVAGVLDALASNPAAATVTVNSGYRDPRHNASVGGARRSQHVLGNAVDINVRGLTDEQKASILDTALEAGAKGIGLYSSGNTIHLDTRGMPAVWSDSYKGIPVEAAPEWAQPGLRDLMAAGPYAVTPRAAPPVPTAKPLSPLNPAPAGTVDRAPLSPAQAPSPALATTNLPGTPYDVQRQQPARPVTPTPVSAPAVPAGQVTRAPLPPARPAFTPPARPVTPTPPAALAAMTAPVTTAGIPPAPSLMSPELMGPEQTFAQQPVQPTFVPAVPQEVQPPVAPPPVAPPPVKPPSVRVAEAHATSSFPAAPKMPSASDVYAGRASVGVASDGSMVSRNSYGGVSITNKYGATTTMTPSGQMAVSYGGPPSVANPGIEGPLGSPGITTPKQSGGLFGIQPAKTETGNLARGVLGSMAGSALGSLAGPVGSLVGAAIGRSIAQGRNPFDALTGNRGDLVTYQSQAFGPIRAVAPNLSGAMGVFPGAPTGVRGALGGNQSNRSMAGMRSISPGAASAISRGQGGLY